ncbi:hypothetical protein KRP22_009415 [Phytophthora ramorum]|nr:hypothetical protein KRP22_8248 [Phytophthora ramorum]
MRPYFVLLVAAAAHLASPNAVSATVEELDQAMTDVGVWTDILPAGSVGTRQLRSAALVDEDEDQKVSMTDDGEERGFVPDTKVLSMVMKGNVTCSAKERLEVESHLRGQLENED